VAKYIGRKKKDPQAILDYVIDWQDWDIDDPNGPYLESGETVASSSWTIVGIDEASPTLVQDAETHNDTLTEITVSGGTAGEKYEVKNTITTSEGRTDERTFLIMVEHR